MISERAQTLLRGAGAAIALSDRGPMMCRASIGTGGPPLGTRVDVNVGFTGECVRSGRALRCDDADTDTRVVPDICRRLGIRSIAAAPVRYERDVVGWSKSFLRTPSHSMRGDLAVSSAWRKLCCSPQASPTSSGAFDVQFFFRKDVFDFELKSGAPHAPMDSTAPNKMTASMLLRPSLDQYTSFRLSQSANSSSVSAAPTP